MPTDGHRSNQRHRVYCKGTILRGVNQSETVCIVSNLSDTGARLKLGIDQHIPQEFLLALSNQKAAHRCRLIWRDGVNAGVTFLGEEAIPRWHYR